MDKPLAMKKGRERASRPVAVEKAISGFRPLRQKSGSAAAFVAVLSLMMAAVVLALPGTALSRSSAGGGTGIHSSAPHATHPAGAAITRPAAPSATVAPALKATPGPAAVTPPISPGARTAPGGRETTPPAATATAPTQQNPAYSDFSCRAACGEQCQRVTCPDLDVSECLAVRQKCRLSCESGC